MQTFFFVCVSVFAWLLFRLGWQVCGVLNGIASAVCKRLARGRLYIRFKIVLDRKVHHILGVWYCGVLMVLGFWYVTFSFV